VTILIDWRYQAYALPLFTFLRARMRSTGGDTTTPAPWSRGLPVPAGAAPGFGEWEPQPHNAGQHRAAV